MEDRIVVYPSRWKLLLLALGALLFVVFGCLIGLGWLDAPLDQVIIAAYVGVPFFGLCFAYLVYRLISPKPSLIVDERGIYDNASALGAGWIRWEEIEEMYAFEYRGQTMLGIIPKDEEEILGRLSLLKRSVMRINTALPGVECPVNIPQTALPITIEELLQRIERFRAKRDQE